MHADHITAKVDWIVLGMSWVCVGTFCDVHALSPDRLQIKAGQAWQAHGYDQGFTAGSADAKEPCNSLILANLLSRQQQNASNAAEGMQRFSRSKTRWHVVFCSLAYSINPSRLCMRLSLFSMQSEQLRQVYIATTRA